MLDEICDPATAPALMAAVANAKSGRTARTNAIIALKRMKAVASLDLMKRRSKDPDDVVAMQAAATAAILESEAKAPAESESGKSPQ